MLRALFTAALLLAAPAAAFAADKPDAKHGETSSYVELPTLTATTTRSDNTRGVITVDDGIDVPDKALRALAVSVEPRLGAAYNRFLSSYALGLPPGAPPNADYMVSQLQRLTDQTLGKPGTRFLVGSILMN